MILKSGTQAETEANFAVAAMVMIAPKMRIVVLAILTLLSQAALAESLVATYSTFVGGRYDAEMDNVVTVATDSAGNVYIGGVTRYELTRPGEIGFPTTDSSLHLPSSRPPDDPCNFQCGYVLKLNSDHEVVYGAILPTVAVQAIAVGQDGAVYVAGKHNSFSGDAPITPGAFSADGEIIVIKVSPDGSSLGYGAMFRGSEARAIAVDDAGQAYVYGDILAAGLPTTPNAIKPVYVPEDNSFEPDTFLLKINSTGTELVFGTYLGGTGAESAYAMALDDVGGVLVTGRTNSVDIPGFPTTNAGLGDGFVLHIAPDGSAILDAAYFRGSDDEFITGISAKDDGGYLISAITRSSDLPVTAGAVQERLIGTPNGWIASLDSNLDISYATYFGGTFVDGALGITSDAEGNAYIVGFTFSPDVLATADAFQSLSISYATSFYSGAGRDFYPVDTDGAREAYFAMLSADLTRLEYGTYLGGKRTVSRNSPAYTLGTTIARAPDGAVYVGGSTLSESFPTTGDGLHDGLAGSQDGFLVKFVPQNLQIQSPTLLPAAKIGEAYQYRLQALGGTPPYRWNTVGFVLPDGLTLDDSGSIFGRALSDQTETWAYQFTVRVTDATGSIAHKNLFIYPLYPLNPECVPNSCRIELGVGNQFIHHLPFPARGVGPFDLVSSGELPPGVEVQASNGTFGGKVTSAGVFDFAFTTTGSFGTEVTMDWQFVVGSNSQPPPVGGNTTGSGGGGGAFVDFELVILLGLALLSLISETKRRRLPEYCRTQSDTVPIRGASPSMDDSN